MGLDQNWPPAFGPWAANGGMDLSAKPCTYLSGAGKKPASTMSLSVLVAIEMFNALNAISEDGSLLTMPPWVNPWLLLAMAVSFGLHFVILYVPFLADIFSIVPLIVNDWIVVTAFSFPVILIDEGLKAHMNKIDAEALPSSAERAELYLMAQQKQSAVLFQQ